MRFRHMLVGILVLFPIRAYSHDTFRPGNQSSGDDSITVARPVRVEGRIDDLIGIATSASEGRVGVRDFRLRPLMREGELLETVPGMIVTQHSGDGKSNQIFLRGFNLDHGTDFRTEVDGMPVNLSTHGHGQGYTDLNFLIPEIVNAIHFRKGLHYADVGDFASAGTARFEIARTIPHPFFHVEYGERGYTRSVGGASRDVGPGHLLFAAETKNYDGPWQLPQNLEKASGAARYSWNRGGHGFSLLGLGYRNSWDASDQIPERAVRSGDLSRFGQVDSTLGGDSERYSVSATWNRPGERSTDDADLYLIHSNLSLYSNFTYFLEDPDRGDQFLQRDERYMLGGSYARSLLAGFLGARHLLRGGLQTRTDFIEDVALRRTERRSVVGTVRADEVLSHTTGIHAEARSDWGSGVRTTVGCRTDFYRFDVESDLERNGGTESAAIVSPKAGLSWRAVSGLEFYASGGFGFHSNDARGTTIEIDPATGEEAETVDPLVRSKGGELGVRWNPVRNARTTIAFWGLDLDSELLYVGDGGGTEASDGSRRYGVEWTNFWRPAPWFTLDFDYSWSRARFVDVPSDVDHIPGALENVLAAGATIETGAGLFGALRVRHLGAYPLVESDEIRANGLTLVNAGAGWETGGIRIALSVLNLLDEEESDIRYYYASRLPGEPDDGVEDVHFHPAEPRQVRGSVGWVF